MRDSIKMYGPAAFNYPESVTQELQTAVRQVHYNMVCIRNPPDLFPYITFPYIDILNLIKPGIFPEIFNCHWVLINSDHPGSGKSFGDKDAKRSDTCEHINDLFAVFYLICDSCPFSRQSRCKIYLCDIKKVPASILPV